MERDWMQYERPTLYQQSMDAVVNLICQKAIPSSTLKSLPLNCKNVLFVLMCRRGKVDESNIGYLIHKKTSKVNLSDCVVSDPLIEALSDRCPCLSELDISSRKGNQNKIDSSHLERLFSIARNLRKVQMKRCDFLTSSTIGVLVRNCGASLLQLNTGGCSKLDDSCLETISNCCPNLECLTVSKSQITDGGVAYLMKNGECINSLLELDVSNCRMLTDVAVEATVRACKKLAIFIFHGCPLMSEYSRVLLETLHRRTNAQLTQVTWTIY